MVEDLSGPGIPGAFSGLFSKAEHAEVASTERPSADDDLAKHVTPFGARRLVRMHLRTSSDALPRATVYGRLGSTPRRRNCSRRARPLFAGTRRAGNSSPGPSGKRHGAPGESGRPVRGSALSQVGACPDRGSGQKQTPFVQVTIFRTLAEIPVEVLPMSESMNDPFAGYVCTTVFSDDDGVPSPKLQR
jgi:hypothetical protein